MARSGLAPWRRDNEKARSREIVPLGLCLTPSSGLSETEHVRCYANLGLREACQRESPYLRPLTGQPLKTSRYPGVDGSASSPPCVERLALNQSHQRRLDRLHRPGDYHQPPIPDSVRTNSNLDLPFGAVQITCPKRRFRPSARCAAYHIC
jgi:hypothetical protein